ncbi:MAG: hypothetical protein WBP03_03335 [Candidatus Saccharimonadales bacterium]
MKKTAASTPKTTAPKHQTELYTELPKEWPGARTAYKYSKAATLVNWQTYLYVFLITLAFSAVFYKLGGNDSTQGRYVLAQIGSMLVSTFLGVSITVIELKNVARKKIDLDGALSMGGRYFVQTFLAGIATLFILIVSFLLLIVPFFFVAPRLVLYPYFIVDKNLGALEALRASWESTRGHVSKVWGIIGMTILYALIMISIIGIPVALYMLFMYSSATALLYRWITRSSTKNAQHGKH